MPHWLITLLVKPILGWLGEKLSHFIGGLLRRRELSERQQKRLELAKELRAIADEMKKIRAEGKDIDESLKNRLREATDKLNSLSLVAGASADSKPPSDGMLDDSWYRGA